MSLQSYGEIQQINEAESDIDCVLYATLTRRRERSKNNYGKITAESLLYRSQIGIILGIWWSISPKDSNPRSLLVNDLRSR